MDYSDTVLRAITDDGSFRVIAVETTSTVRDAVEAQGPTAPLRRTFADFLTGAVLVYDDRAETIVRFK